MRIFRLITFMLIVVSIAGCGGKGGDDPEPTREEEVTKMLTSGSWKISSVKVDGVAQSADYMEGLAISFSNGTYTVTNGEPFFSAGDTWNFTSSDATAITTGNGLTIDIQSISNQALSISFTWTGDTLGTGRSKSISGTHLLTFTH